MMFQMVAASCGNRALNVDVGIIDCFSAKIGKIGERGKGIAEKIHAGRRGHLCLWTAVKRTCRIRPVWTRARGIHGSLKQEARLLGGSHRRYIVP